ncbi:MAG: hypothetical protein II738_03800 [Clostridia bacterium]|nr:hypothetical protein [Clostridia bacterium]
MPSKDKAPKKANTNKAEAKAAKKAKEQAYEEKLKKKGEYADAAYRKKVSIIMLCILCAFIIGVTVFVLIGWQNRKNEDKRLDNLELQFQADRDSVRDQLREIEANGGTHEDKRAVKIEVNDDNFIYWISEIDSTYNVEKENARYAMYGGAEIHLQGVFITRKFAGNNKQYWVYRRQKEDDANRLATLVTGEIPLDEKGDVDVTNMGTMYSIEVILDDNAEIPANGTWVDVRGVVGPDTFKSLSGVRDATLTVLPEPGNEFVE